MNSRALADTKAMPWLKVAVALIATLFGASGYTAPLEKKPHPTLHELLDGAGVPGWLLSVDAAIEFEASEVTTPNVKITDVRLPVRIKDQKVSVDEARLRTFDGDISLDLLIDAPGNSFDASVRARNLSFDNSQAPRDETDTSMAPHVFSEEEILPLWLPAAAGRVVFDVSNVRLRGSSLEQLNGHLSFAETTMRGTLKSRLANGRLLVDIAHDYPSEQTTITASGNALPLHLMPATHEYLLDTALNFELAIDGQGRSARNLAESLNGRVIIEAMHGNLNVDNLEKLSQDILSLTLTSVVPILTGRKIAKLECGVLKFDIRDGVANSDNAIAVRTDNLAIMGGGRIDFARETLDIRLHPHARSKNAVNTKSAVKELKLSGPLRNIEVTPQLGGIINQGISLTTKIAALGLSKLPLPLLDWAAPADVACMSNLDTPAP